MQIIKFIRKCLYKKKKEKAFYRRTQRKMDKIASGMLVFSNNNFDYKSSNIPYNNIFLPHIGGF